VGRISFSAAHRAGGIYRLFCESHHLLGTFWPANANSQTRRGREGRGKSTATVGVCNGAEREGNSKAHGARGGARGGLQANDPRTQASRSSGLRYGMPKELTLEDYKVPSTSRFKCTAFLDAYARQWFLGSAAGVPVVSGSLTD
jgi:hypothetical protein